MKRKMNKEKLAEKVLGKIRLLERQFEPKFKAGDTIYYIENGEVVGRLVHGSDFHGYQVMKPFNSMTSIGMDYETIYDGTDVYATMPEARDAQIQKLLNAYQSGNEIVEVDDTDKMIEGLRRKYEH